MIENSEVNSIICVDKLQNHIIYQYLKILTIVCFSKIKIKINFMRCVFTVEF